MKTFCLSLALLCLSACAEYRWAAPIAWQASPELRNVTAKAIAEWQSVSGFATVERAGGIVVRYGNVSEASTAWTVDGAHITGATVTISPSHVSSLYRLVLHEMGHALGLAHSTVKQSIMYAEPFVGHLRADDISAIRHLYSSGRPGRRA